VYVPEKGSVAGTYDEEFSDPAEAGALDEVGEEVEYCPEEDDKDISETEDSKTEDSDAQKADIQNPEAEQPDMPDSDKGEQI